MTSLNLQTQPKPESNLLFIRPEIVSYTESIERIKKISTQLGNQLRLSSIYESPKYVSIVMYYLALRAQVYILKHLNDDLISCPIVWNSTTGLPSHPSMVADIRKFVEEFEIPDLLKVVLLSFSEWTILQSENFLCCCGKDGQQRKVELDVMINTVLRSSDRKLMLKMIVGIRSDNKDHLRNHYDFGEQSKVADDIYKIWICENTICITDDRVKIECVSSECAELFDNLMFSTQVWQLLNQMPSQ
jgi:hypothetical protein